MKVCVLIAGLPASGKTTFARRLGEALALPMVSKDEIKEILYDSVGFSCKQDKVTLSIAGTKLLYYYAESLMRSGRPFILENNFENVIKSQLQALLAQYSYQALTIRFGGDVRVIYERYVERGKSPDRHPGHGAGASYPPRPGEGLLNGPMSFESFVEGVSERGIAEFSVGGEELHVDATHFEQVDYVAIIRRVEQVLQREGPPHNCGGTNVL